MGAGRTSVSFYSESGDPEVLPSPGASVALSDSLISLEGVGEGCVDETSPSAPTLGLEPCPAPGKVRVLSPCILHPFSATGSWAPWRWTRLDPWRGAWSEPRLPVLLNLGLDYVPGQNSAEFFPRGAGELTS